MDIAGHKDDENCSLASRFFVITSFFGKEEEKKGRIARKLARKLQRRDQLFAKKDAQLS